MNFSMRTDKDLKEKNQINFDAYNQHLIRREEEMRQQYAIQQLIENPPLSKYAEFLKKQFEIKTKGEKEMNDKIKKTINWINFGISLLGIVVKVIQEITEILPKGEETNE